MLAEITQIVRQAAAYMNTGDFVTYQKEGFANIVTSSDIGVQQYLCKELSALLPGSGFFCEEEKRHDAYRENTWIIDPIDGTANYARGIPTCAISVALCQQGVVTLGVVYNAAANEMFTAQKGVGSWLNGKPIHVSGRQFADSMLCGGLGLYHKHLSDKSSRLIYDVFRQCNDIRLWGSAALGLCYLAMGRVELFFEVKLMPWDYAAGQLILTEAGGSITSRGWQPVQYVEMQGIVAANSEENLGKLMSLVRTHFGD